MLVPTSEVSPEPVWPGPTPAAGPHATSTTIALTIALHRVLLDIELVDIKDSIDRDEFVESIAVRIDLGIARVAHFGSETRVALVLGQLEHLQDVGQ